MPDTFGKRLRNARQRKFLSQGKLARKTGIIQSQLSKYEHDKALPNCTTLEWLCTALNISASELLGF